MVLPFNMERTPTGPGGLFYGVYPAVVTELGTGSHNGYVKVVLPWSPDNQSDEYEVWARVAVLMAGGNRGTWYIPDSEDEVLVAFAGGHPEHPYVVGALWNGQDAPPEEMDSSRENNLKTICSREGIRITMDDTQGAVKLTLETPGGHVITMDDSDRSLTIEDSNENFVKLEPSKITVTSTVTLEINASMVNVNAPLSTFSGIVKCASLAADALVTSPTYTPGAGNVW